MTLHADTLIDRIRLKQQVTRWRLLAIIIAFLAIAFYAERHSQIAPILGTYIARVTIDGVIDDNREVSERLKDLRDDPDVKAVIVWLNTPGGTAIGGQQLYLDLRDVAEKKPVVSVMRSMATSAGYMTALGTDYIVAREGTITGSIGVILQSMEFSELAKKLGVNPITIKTGEHKGAPLPGDVFTTNQRVVIQEAIDDFYAWFVDVVARRRNIPVQQARQYADGRIFSGRQALDRKLIDALGGEEEAIIWLEKNRKIDSSLDVRDIILHPEEEEPSWLRGLARDAMLGVSGAAKDSILGLDGLLLIWQAKAL